MKRILTLFLSMFCYIAFAQHNDTQAGLYNIGLGLLTGGIGAMINKKPEEKLGKVFLKGLWQGAIGGYTIFESKRLIRLIYQNNELGYSWPSKLVNAAGVSMVENAAANRDFWERWHIDYGFNRVEFDCKDRLSVRYKVMPVALVYTVGIATQAKFEVGKTLQSGQFMFSSTTRRWEETNSIGAAFPGNIVYKPDAPEMNKLLSHEIIHLYQFNDINGINTYFDKPRNHFADTSTFFAGVDKWVYFDFNNIIHPLLYELQNINRVDYYDNFYEHEAGYYSDTLYP